MMNDIMTSIKQVDGGCVIKSGDTASVFEFEVLGDDGLRKTYLAQANLPFSMQKE